MADSKQPRNYSPHQQKIIKRYYDNLEDSKFQRLTELLQPSLGRRGAPVDQPPPPARGRPLVNPTLRNDARFRASLQDMLARTQSWYGQNTAPGEFAAAVALVGADCSGTLIAPNVVLTASHCWCHGMSPTGVLFGESRQTGAAVTIDLTRSRRMTTSCADGDLQRGDAAARRPMNWSPAVRAACVMATAAVRCWSRIRQPTRITWRR